MCEQRFIACQILCLRQWAEDGLEQGRLWVELLSLLPIEWLL